MNKRTQVITALAAVTCFIIIASLNKNKDQTQAVQIPAPERAQPLIPSEPPPDPFSALINKAQSHAGKFRTTQSLALANLHAGDAEPVSGLLDRALSVLAGINSINERRDLIEGLSDSLKPFAEVSQVNGFNDPIIVALSQPEGNSKGSAEVQPQESSKTGPSTAVARTPADPSDDPFLDLINKAETQSLKFRATQSLALANLHAGQAETAKGFLDSSLILLANIESIEEKGKLIEDLMSSLKKFAELSQVSNFNLQIATIKNQLTPKKDPALVLVDKIEGPHDQVKVLCDFSASLSQAGDKEQASSTLAKALSLVTSIEDNAKKAAALTHVAVAQTKCGLPEEGKASLAAAMTAIKSVDPTQEKAAALREVMSAIERSGNENDKKIVLDQSVEIAKEIQKRSATIMEQALNLVTQFKDGKQRALAMQQIAQALEDSKAAPDFADLEFKLASLYQDGVDLEKNPTQAALWYQKAARLGHSTAQVNLALLLLSGEGISSNPQEAISWLSKAANQGNAEGQASLGMIYALGQGVTPDLVKAQKWIILAADQGNKEAQAALKQLATKLSSEEKTMAQELVKQWRGKNSSETKESAAKKEPVPEGSKA